MRYAITLTAGLVSIAAAACNGGGGYFLDPKTTTYSAIVPLIENQYFVVFDSKACAEPSCSTFRDRDLSALEKVGVATLDENNNLLSVRTIEVEAVKSLRAESLPNDLESACLPSVSNGGHETTSILVAESGGTRRISRIFRLDVQARLSGWHASVIETWYVRWTVDPFKGFEGMVCEAQPDGSIDVWFATRGYHPAWPAHSPDPAQIYRLALQPGGGDVDLSSTPTFDVIFGNPTTGQYQAGQTFSSPEFLLCAEPVSMDQYAELNKDQVATQRDISDLQLRRYGEKRELWASAAFDGAESESYCSAIYKICDYSTCLQHFTSGSPIRIPKNAATIVLDSNKTEGFLFPDSSDTSRVLVATDEEESGIIGVYP